MQTRDKLVFESHQEFFFRFCFPFAWGGGKLENFKLLKLEKERFHSVVEIELFLG